MTDPRTFYTERIPAEFNAAFDEQERRGAAARDVYEAMRAVTATLRVDVTGEGGGTFFLNVERGRMRADDAPAQPPFLTVVQDRTAFERLAAEAGDSAMALLGGLSGLTGSMHLTQDRVDNLGGIDGSVGFEVEGPDGFRVVTHFGSAPPPDEPGATIRMSADDYARLRSGELSAPLAFMEGKIAVEGDLQLAMQLAFAAVAPD